MPGFISLSYWLSIYPQPMLSSVQTALLALFGLFVVIGLWILYVRRRSATSKVRKHALSSLGYVVLWFGICGLIWLFMSWAAVPVLGMRLVLPMLVILFGFLSLRPIRMLRTEIPQAELGAQSRANYEKWLPKPKK